jgi:perosamine synthetase
MTNFQRFNFIGAEEKTAVNEVLDSGILSGFIAQWGEGFLGGPKVQEFESLSKKLFESPFVISFNSWTSGLISAIKALQIEPGDEIITTPWTMSATAAAILHCGCIPIFADIQPDTFCLDPKAVEGLIGPRTKAILSVDIFGQSANTEALMAFAKTYNLVVISDSAQAPGATRHGRQAGTLTHFGGLSFNYHKQIHCGEGGLLFCSDRELALRAQLVRNHAEVSVVGSGLDNEPGLLGFNFRMGEIEAAICIAQLSKLEYIVARRQRIARMLDEELSNIPGLILPKVDEGNSHSYYVYALRIDSKHTNLNRNSLIARLESKGFDFFMKSYQNIHLLPVFQNKNAWGASGFPWNAGSSSSNFSYEKGICPVAENLQDKEFLGIYLNSYDFSDEDILRICKEFKTTWWSLV